MNKTVLVFDLDDTLYKEIDFLKSAYKEISNLIASVTPVSSSIIYNQMFSFYENDLNAFEEILKYYKLEKFSALDLVQIYRNHEPSISLTKDIQELLTRLKKHTYKIGLITDGRSVQQRSKLKALNLLDYFDDIIISEEFGSEKPSSLNFEYYVNKYGADFKYFYVGDNTKKDFIAPNQLGWTSVCLKDVGQNIHNQDFDISEEQKPKHLIESLESVETLVLYGSLS
ncbi:HAD family hydrolase [Tamlana sp. 2_MG-2023]|uniref:HAD family hydrolase n=1 Tax=unclassified Tamlana TaxID=2614803 RepID=UPI0026E1418D|nr:MULTISPECIES: HAD family hydrolase [unclassified Tamlana]MDO6759410.1 HAD family hydrolase [Tamlana sp. 2_MG-2023]MDO6790451.1 HAD family hydrolase [Tamlana sp. 1_MG-2023]